jgi:hypothetical protein
MERVALLWACFVAGAFALPAGQVLQQMRAQEHSIGAVAPAPGTTEKAKVPNPKGADTRALALLSLVLPPAPSSLSLPPPRPAAVPWVPANAAAEGIRPDAARRTHRVQLGRIGAEVGRGA